MTTAQLYRCFKKLSNPSKIMARGSSRLPIINLCPNLIRTRIRFRSPTLLSKPESPKIETNRDDGTEMKECCDNKLTNNKEETRRKVMVVVDSSQEAKTALHWALSSAVQPDDIVVLLDVIEPSTIGENSERASRGAEKNRLLHAMQSICQAKRPEVHVELLLVEGRERGPTIVDAARKQGISLLVIGQKKRSVALRLLMIWAAGGKTIGDTAEYCVQNATCMALAVRRKSKKGGGYLITTKRLKDFWLLA
ncbi:Adenine nucleotide alpha hydrolases-like superfamily protein [Rhynchospora pubera]|uniref:Adenine nucleotide alpha hydrolases-like superfamily protein n=1 Tax=Rhynchospora pubera TaxID=906938 RepID=A0AAV8FCC1_9POAL|nr:Adenine nucleotide alpha hydrolases-like superfamily protein [Rhynchospora pubera]